MPTPMLLKDRVTYEITVIYPPVPPLPLSPLFSFPYPHTVMHNKTAQNE